MMPARLRSLIVKEFIQFLRDPVMIILILWLFTVEIVMCTMALGFDVRRIPLAVNDYDRTTTSRALMDEFLSTDSFVLVGTPSSMAEAASWLQEGRIIGLLEIPSGFERRFRSGDDAAVQFVLDGMNSNTALRARAYATEMIARFNAVMATRTTVLAMPTDAVVRVWYNPALTNTRFMVLSMISLAALMAGVLHPAASIVREKQVGTIEQLQVTPMLPLELFAAKTLPTFAVCLIAMMPALLITRLFGVPLLGSLPLLLILTGLLFLSAIGIGVFISAVSATLQQAILLSFFSLVPMMFLSGTMAPIESMPDWLQLLSLASPLRHYMDIILGVFLKGVGLRELWPQALALLAIGAASYGSAYALFRRGWR